MSTYYGLEGSLGDMYWVQRRLAQAQAVPLYGPLVFSPIKAIVSVAQTAFGFLGLLYTEFVCRYYGDESLKKHQFVLLYHGMMGLAGIGYSYANFRLFGVIGIGVETVFHVSSTQLF